MTAISDDIIKYFKDSGLIDNFTVQYEQWLDGDKPYYLVIIPDSGMTAQPWIRSPNYRVIIVGPKAKRAFSSGGIGGIAEGLISYMRDNRGSCLHQLIEPTEPSPPITTESDRRMITFSLMTKLAV